MPRITAFAAALLAVLTTLGAPGLKPVRAATGVLQLTVVDRETRRPIPCRMHLRNAAGRPRKPRGLPFWEDHFVFAGNITMKLPLGQYSFELERGPDYVERGGRFVINRNASDSKEVDLFRFVDMSSHGWWSGDLDVRRPVGDIELLMLAEDLHVVPVTTWWNDQDPWRGKSLPEKLVIQFDRNRYYHLMAGAHTWPGGTLLCFNLPAPLGTAAVSGEFPPPITYLEKARQHAGAWVDVSRPFWWDLPMLVAHGQVDSIQLAHGNLCRERVIESEAGGKARDCLACRA